MNGNLKFNIRSGERIDFIFNCTSGGTVVCSFFFKPHIAPELKMILNILKDMRTTVNMLSFGQLWMVI